jgi:hypothetical protein
VGEACRRLGRAVELDPGSVDAAAFFARAQQECASPAEAKLALDRLERLRMAVAPASYQGPETPGEGEPATPPAAGSHSLVVALTTAGIPLQQYSLNVATVTEPEPLVGWEPVLHDDLVGLFDPDVSVADVLRQIEVGDGLATAEVEAAAETEAAAEAAPPE